MPTLDGVKLALERNVVGLQDKCQNCVPNSASDDPDPPIPKRRGSLVCASPASSLLQRGLPTTILNLAIRFVG
jgi:hypothetical protein